MAARTCGPFAVTWAAFTTWRVLVCFPNTTARAYIRPTCPVLRKTFGGRENVHTRKQKKEEEDGLPLKFLRCFNHARLAARRCFEPNSSALVLISLHYLFECGSSRFCSSVSIGSFICSPHQLCLSRLISKEYVALTRVVVGARGRER